MSLIRCSPVIQSLHEIIVLFSVLFSTLVRQWNARLRYPSVRRTHSAAAAVARAHLSLRVRDLYYETSFISACSRPFLRDSLIAACTRPAHLSRRRWNFPCETWSFVGPCTRPALRTCLTRPAHLSLRVWDLHYETCSYRCVHETSFTGPLLRDLS